MRRLTGPVEGGLPPRGLGPALSRPPTPRSLSRARRRALFGRRRSARWRRPAPTGWPLAKRVDGVVTPLGGAARVRGRGRSAAPRCRPRDRAALLAFQRKTARLQRAVLGAVAGAARGRQPASRCLKKALDDTPGARPAARWPRRARSRPGSPTCATELSGDAVRREPQRADAALDRRARRRDRQRRLVLTPATPPRPIAAATRSRPTRFATLLPKAAPAGRGRSQEPRGAGRERRRPVDAGPRPDLVQGVTG